MLWASHSYKHITRISSFNPHKQSYKGDLLFPFYRWRHHSKRQIDQQEGGHLWRSHQDSLLPLVLNILLNTSVMDIRASRSLDLKEELIVMTLIASASCMLDIVLGALHIFSLLHTIMLQGTPHLNFVYEDIQV